ncbi:ATP-binding cassette domain-containing protein [Pedobacter sp. SD-b]|uniref:ATP-binding cassette domain-containing protein n=1 Tax=Pedobacter segetis TaxID=2793069 RepID=A0ABS1BGL3_9SPHI|nr:ATP-binding cassette domain-containing protein [Pedobacter segetis]MBK0382004.1 ATP-binding cassette domain-containing protein [Pedobacter segetis]
MKIVLAQIGRRFNREWIFNHIDYTFETGKSYAILGINGSGKSTLLQIISGALTSSVGNISYFMAGKEIQVEEIFQHFSLAAPYLDLIEEFTLLEVLEFHFNFKKRIDGLTNEQLVDLLNMQKSKNKQLKYFSSGMKQRVKLLLAFCSDTPLLLLDEPTANLDEQGIIWYLELVKTFADNRLIIVCSNQAHEYAFCDHKILVADYK